MSGGLMGLGSGSIFAYCEELGVAGAGVEEDDDGSSDGDEDDDAGAFTFGDDELWKILGAAECDVFDVPRPVALSGAGILAGAACDAGAFRSALPACAPDAWGRAACGAVVCGAACGAPAIGRSFSDGADEVLLAAAGAVAADGATGVWVSFEVSI